MPAPLVPPDCDVRRMPYMPLDINRLLASDLFLTASDEVFRVALTIWCKSWLQVPASSLPSDDKLLAILSGAGRRWKRLKPLALRGFILCDDGRYYHPVIAEKAMQAWSKSIAGKKANQVRWQSDRISDRTPTVYPREVEVKRNIKEGVEHGSKIQPPEGTFTRLRDALKSTPVVKILDSQNPHPKPNGNDDIGNRPGNHPADQTPVKILATDLPKGWSRPGNDQAMLAACKMLGINPGRDTYKTVIEKIRQRINP